MKRSIVATAVLAVASPIPTFAAESRAEEIPVIAILQGHIDQIRALAWSPDGKRLASADIRGIAKIWSFDGAEKAVTIRGQPRWGRSLASSPDGTLLAVGFDEIVRICDSSSGEELRALKGGGPRLTPDL